MPDLESASRHARRGHLLLNVGGWLLFMIAMMIGFLDELAAAHAPMPDAAARQRMAALVEAA